MKTTRKPNNARTTSIQSQRIEQSVACSIDTVILEIGLTFRHIMIAFWPHCQDISLNIILSLPLLNEGGRNFINTEHENVKRVV